MQVVNIVATVKLEKSFDLKELLAKLPSSERIKMGVRVYIPSLDRNIIFYKSGKFLVRGVKSENETKYFANEVSNFLALNSVNNSIKKIKYNNYVLTGKLDFEVDLNNLIFELKDFNATYDPEQYHSLYYKDKNNITYILFGSGKFILVGVKSLNNLEEHVNEFKNLIREKSNI
ncbi:hypothetical protein [Methanobrevibacter sp. UBA188]|uniref:hypothetical protein n=1 Tax=Methanobrevibacter sp. UBA188 TaxID=1915473 RepID=UPI0025CC492F|nr:hypothetical protein [Methanobrevibacter sp. UBA188]